MFAAIALAAALLVQVVPGLDVPAEDAPAVARYFGDVAVEQGDAVWVDDELVPSTLDLWAYLALAQCESGGNWHIYGPLYSGGLQFLDSTWRAVGGTGRAADAPIAEQIERARTLVSGSGWSPWPVCSRKAGLRK